MSRGKKALEELILSRGETLKSASLAIGRNHAYLFQFITKGSPRVFPELERQKLARFLDVDEKYLKDLLGPEGGGMSERSAAGFRGIQNVDGAARFSDPAPVEMSDVSQRPKFTKELAQKAAQKATRMMVNGTEFENNGEFCADLEWEIFKEIWSEGDPDLSYERIEKIFDEQVTLNKQRTI